MCRDPTPGLSQESRDRARGGSAAKLPFRKAAPVGKVGSVRSKGPWGRAEQQQPGRRAAPCTIYRYLLLLCQRGAVTVRLNLTSCVCALSCPATLFWLFL